MSQNWSKTTTQNLINPFRVCQGKYNSGIELKQYSNHEEKSKKTGENIIDWQMRRKQLTISIAKKPLRHGSD